MTDGKRRRNSSRRGRWVNYVSEKMRQTVQYEHSYGTILELSPASGGASFPTGQSASGRSVCRMKRKWSSRRQYCTVQWFPRSAAVCCTMYSYLVPVQEANKSITLSQFYTHSHPRKIASQVNLFIALSVKWHSSVGGVNYSLREEGRKPSSTSASGRISVPVPALP